MAGVEVSLPDGWQPCSTRAGDGRGRSPLRRRAPSFAELRNPHEKGRPCSAAPFAPHTDSRRFGILPTRVPSRAIHQTAVTLPLQISIRNRFTANALAARRSHPPDAAHCESKGGSSFNSCWAALPLHSRRHPDRLPFFAYYLSLIAWNGYKALPRQAALPKVTPVSRPASGSGGLAGRLWLGA